MHKKLEDSQQRPRVLARVLADDLRVVSGACDCAPSRTVETYDTNGQWDITNTGPDGD